MDKSWIHESRLSPAYEVGVARFLDYAYANTSWREIKCPCMKCYNVCKQTRDVVYDHLICNGILESYACKDWDLHGERALPKSSDASRKVETKRAQKKALDQSLSATRQQLGAMRQELSEMEEELLGSADWAQGMTPDQESSALKQRLSHLRAMEQKFNAIEQALETSLAH